MCREQRRFSYRTKDKSKKSGPFVVIQLGRGRRVVWVKEPKDSLRKWLPFKKKKKKNSLLFIDYLYFFFCGLFVHIVYFFPLGCLFFIIHFKHFLCVRDTNLFFHL